MNVACMQGHAEIARLLLEGGADVNKAARDTPGLTPLILACKNGHGEVVRLLLHGPWRSWLERGDGRRRFDTSDNLP
jgi:ankyrin repeat protein